MVPVYYLFCFLDLKCFLNYIKTYQSLTRPMNKTSVKSTLNEFYFVNVNSTDFN